MFPTYQHNQQIYAKRSNYQQLHSQGTQCNFNHIFTEIDKIKTFIQDHIALTRSKLSPEIGAEYTAQSSQA